MGYLALYRKYRPNTFDKVIGQEHIVKTLINQIESGKLGHAYLFTGTRGTGKTSVAKIFAKAVNCLSPENGSPCGKCEVCKALSDPSNIDVVEIDAASNNGVNEIRDLREKVQYAPVSCKYKVYIIDEVHMLTGAAFNALLKTLEEPPKHAIFILATTEVHKIPATILSRCMRFDFRLVPIEEIVSMIKSIYDEQGKQYDEDAIFSIARAGEGSVRDALSIAETAMSFSSGKLTYEDVNVVLGSSNFDILTDFLSGLFDSDLGKVLSLVEELCAMGKSMGVLTKDVTEIIRNIIVVKTCSSPEKILKIPSDRIAKLKEIADSTSEERLIRCLEIFSDVENELKYTVHPRVVFETATIKATRPDSDFDIGALLARIKSLEEKIENGNFSLNTEIKTAFEPTIENKTVKKTELQEQKEDKEEIKKPTKLLLSDNKPNDVLGKLLINLRKNGHEMLWNVMQSVRLDIFNNNLIFITTTSGDAEILDRADNREYIEQALEEFMPFAIEIKDRSGEKFKAEIDDATEKMKKIFGDDIVIIE